MQWEEQLIGWGCAAFFVLFPTVIITVLRFATGVTWTLDAEPGPVLRRSWLGSAGVNDVACNGMVQVVEHAAGWMIRVHPTLVFGVMWFPKGPTEVSTLRPGGWFYSRSRTLEYGSDTVLLCGHLADFVTVADESQKNT